MTSGRRTAIIAGMGAWMAALTAGGGLLLVLAKHENVLPVVVLCASVFLLLLATLIAIGQLTNARLAAADPVAARWV